MTMSKDLIVMKGDPTDIKEEEEEYDSDDEDIDVGSNNDYTESISDNEADSEMTSDDNAVIKKVGVRSFGIDDILGHDSVKTSGGQRMSDKRQGQGRSPLDALFTMTTNFESMKQKSDKIEIRKDIVSKKKRKSRTAFTNHQIFELEKRFLYQKYLSPADRDDISNTLGLSGGQVITWFQNRRAKFKRDLEEMKKDVEKGGAGVPGPQQQTPSPHHLISDNIRLQHPPPPPPPTQPRPPGYGISIPVSLPSLPHPLPLLCLAPHLLQYPFHHHRPASASPRSKSPSPPIRALVAESQPIKVENPSV